MKVTVVFQNFSHGKGGGGCLIKVMLIVSKYLLLNQEGVHDSCPFGGLLWVSMFRIRYFYHGKATIGFRFDAGEATEHLLGFKGSLELVF
jgi:hypothetical protein